MTLLAKQNQIAQFGPKFSARKRNNVVNIKWLVAMIVFTQAASLASGVVSLPNLRNHSLPLLREIKGLPLWRNAALPTWNLIASPAFHVRTDGRIVWYSALRLRYGTCPCAILWRVTLALKWTWPSVQPERKMRLARVVTAAWAGGDSVVAKPFPNSLRVAADDLGYGGAVQAFDDVFFVEPIAINRLLRSLPIAFALTRTVDAGIGDRRDEVDAAEFADALLATRSEITLRRHG